MAEPDNPKNPEAWFDQPGVCGSCVAWRPTEGRSDDLVAIGLCRLRPELRRVPASLAKCPKYSQRGGFTYEPGRVAKPSRKRSAPATVKRRNEAGELVDVSPRPKPSGTGAKRPSRQKMPTKVALENAKAGSGELPDYVALAEPTYRPFPVAADIPTEIDLGSLNGPLADGALRDLFDEEVPGRRRDMHSKFRRGGTVRAVDGSGVARTVPAHRFFGWLARLAKTLDALEEAVDTHPQFGSEVEELIGQIRRMRGSLTTFNVMFDDRADYFSGKE